MNNNLVVATPQELQSLITNAVIVAVQQISLPQKIEPLPVSNFMTIEQASLYLNLAKQTIYGLTCNRTIPFIKKGKLYFEKTELDKWLLEDKKSTKKQLIQKLKQSKQ